MFERKSTPIIGLDISSTAVKMLELRKKRQSAVAALPRIVTQHDISIEPRNKNKGGFRGIHPGCITPNYDRNNGNE
ncbi:MAG: hypothetical protein GKR94_27215 [Gammaproteobacteria bacterium]|nr:hypothetical protein [Gammaproteobacteria bacterium]